MTRHLVASNRPRGRRADGAALALAGLVALTTGGSASAESSAINATVEVAALQVGLALSASDIRAGDKVRAQATVANLGARPVRVTVELRFDQGGVAVKGAATTAIARLQPGRSATVAWNLCALRAGQYVLLARATAAGAAVDSPARVLTITGQRPKGCT